MRSVEEEKQVYDTKLETYRSEIKDLTKKLEKQTGKLRKEYSEVKKAQIAGNTEVKENQNVTNMQAASANPDEALSEATPSTPVNSEPSPTTGDDNNKHRYPRRQYTRHREQSHDSYYLGNLGDGVTVGTIENFLSKSHDIDVYKVNVFSCKTKGGKCARIEVATGHRQQILRPHFFPRDVYARRWYDN